MGVRNWHNRMSIIVRIVEPGYWILKIPLMSGFLVLEAGLEPARPDRHYPLKIACLPDSTTSAQKILTLAFPKGYSPVPGW